MNSSYAVFPSGVPYKSAALRRISLSWFSKYVLSADRSQSVFSEPWNRPSAMKRSLSILANSHSNCFHWSISRDASLVPSCASSSSKEPRDPSSSVLASPRYSGLRRLRSERKCRINRRFVAGRFPLRNPENSSKAVSNYRVSNVLSKSLAMNSHLA